MSKTSASLSLPSDILDQIRNLSAKLAPGVSERDFAGGRPDEEVAAIKSSGLLFAGVSKELGGEGLSFGQTLQVVRLLAQTDPSAASIFGYHALHLWRIRFQAEPEVWRRVHAETVAKKGIWGGAGNRKDNPIVLADAEIGYSATGRKFFATGAQIADFILFNVLRQSDGRTLVAYAAQDGTTISHGDDWNGLGVRRSASGSVRFDLTPVDASQIIATLPDNLDNLDHRRILSPLGFQALFVFLYLGILEGALLNARAYTRTQSRPFGDKGIQPTEDPYVVEQYGKLVTHAAASSALIEQLGIYLDAYIEKAETDLASLGDTDRIALDALISAAKANISNSVLEVTGSVFEVTGARAATRGHILEVFWRDARTHTLHDPVKHHLENIGRLYLSGDLPAQSRADHLGLI